MSKHVEPVTAWAAVWTTDNPKPFILAHTTSTTRAAVIEYMGDAWRHEIDGETWRQGWKRAYRRGCRAVRVEIRVKEEG